MDTRNIKLLLMLLFVLFGSLAIYLGFVNALSDQNSEQTNRAILNLSLLICAASGILIILITLLSYYKNPEHGRGGWVLTIIGFLLISPTVYKNIEVTKDGIKGESQYDGGSRGAVDGFNDQAILSRQIKDLEDAVKGIKERLDKVPVATGVKPKQNDVNINSESSLKEKIENLVNIDQYKDLLDRIKENQPQLLKPFYLAILELENSKISEPKVKALGDVMTEMKSRMLPVDYYELIPTLMSYESQFGLRQTMSSADIDRFSQWIEGLRVSSPALSWTILDTLHIKLAGLTQHSTELNTVQCSVYKGMAELEQKPYGHFKSARMGNILYLRQDSVPLRDAAPSKYWGTFGKEINKLEPGTILKFVDSSETTWTSAPWVNVEIICSSTSKGLLGWIAWFPQRFYYVPVD